MTANQRITLWSNRAVKNTTLQTVGVHHTMSHVNPMSHADWTALQTEHRTAILNHTDRVRTADRTGTWQANVGMVMGVAVCLLPFIVL